MVLQVSIDRGAQMVANVKKDQRACRVAVVLVLLVMMGSLNVDLTVHLQSILFRDFSSRDGGSRSHGKAQELLDKLKQTARLAAGGKDYTLTAAERNAWHEQNPCQSRSELPTMYANRKHIRDISPNPMWDKVLAAYADLHRICRKKVSNVTELFLSNEANATIPGCKFLVTEGKYGLGNKLLVTISALLYAIVSQRIILVPSGMTFSTVLCEPFVGSSWFFNENSFPMPQPDEINRTWVEGSVFLEGMSTRLSSLNEDSKEDAKKVSKPSDQGLKIRAEPSPPLVNALVVAAAEKLEPWFPDKWFFCNTEQRYLSAVPWVYFSGCIYSIPDLFASAPFGGILQDLFPDRMVSTRLLRSTILPSDSVWSRFKHLDRLYFQHSDRRVGVQLRFFYDTHKTRSDLLNRRVMRCALENGILPFVNKSSPEQSVSPPPTAPVTTVFIASLYSDLKDRMGEYYLRYPTATGQAVRVVQVSSRSAQWEGTEEDREALVEMLLLSLADRLLVTPASTFGHLGQAYGGLTPWIIRVTPEDGESCVRAQTVDPCQQNEYLGYKCANDPPDQWATPDGLLDLCLKVDWGERIAYGVQILDNHLSWQEEHQEM